ncbi:MULTISPECIES: hypothetical protein [unclassified Bradyrhizobium]|uniref:hypothetical protein n=1 Tax=unclassified Bradyrhizobium TaxID=2631580 RepID=UPI002915CC9D|nr:MULTISPECIES: hypothetical protein [unclassified Bradyrhizobium]
MGSRRHGNECHANRPQRGAEILAEVARAHDQDLGILAKLGRCLEAARDIDDLIDAATESQEGRCQSRISARAAGLSEREAIDRRRFDLPMRG